MFDATNVAQPPTADDLEIVARIRAQGEEEPQNVYLASVALSLEDYKERYTMPEIRAALYVFDEAVRTHRSPLQAERVLTESAIRARMMDALIVER